MIQQTVSQAKRYRPIEIEGCEALVPDPDQVPSRPFVGQHALIQRCLAAWLDIDGTGGLHFRLVGSPGVGKNELVYHLSRLLKLPIFIMQGHEELTPEDIACTARISGEMQRVEYVASPLVAAMVHGGICFFDELGKVPPRALSLLASVLDTRRSLTSALAGFTLRAHPNFRFCAAMNSEDVSSLPRFIDERLRPALTVDPPRLDELVEIVSGSPAGQETAVLEAFREWAATADGLSPREALTVMNFALRLRRQGKGGRSNGSPKRIIREAAQAVIQESLA